MRMVTLESGSITSQALSSFAGEVSELWMRGPMGLG